MDDIKKFELEDVKNFFQRYYNPNNASLVIGGNFKIEETKRLVEKYFGEIPKGNSVSLIDASLQTIKENIKVIHEDNVQLPRIHLAWHSDKMFGEDDASLDILADILSSSKNSRLQKVLLFDKQKAQDVSAFQYSAKLSGSFIILSTAKPGVTLDEIKKEVLREIDRLIVYGVTKEELIRSKNSIKSSYIYSLQRLDTLVDNINHYNYFLNEPDSFVYDINRYEKVTAEQVKETAKRYLQKPYVELQIIPKPN
jgi:zinc protease